MNNFQFIYWEDIDSNVPEEENNNDSDIDLSEIEKNLVSINEKLDTLTTENTVESTELVEESTEEEQENPDVSGIVFLDDSADTHNYLSTPVENASLDDLYTVMLSTRNILLLFVIMYFMVRLLGALKNVLYRLMDK